jgi:hypothetical protein
MRTPAVWDSSKHTKTTERSEPARSSWTTSIGTDIVHQLTCVNLRTANHSDLFGFFRRTAALLYNECREVNIPGSRMKILMGQRESNYHMRNVQHKLWSDVSADMNEPDKYLTSILL